MSKPSLVLLPGMLCDKSLWAHQVSHLSDVVDISIGNLTSFDSIQGMAQAVLEKSPPQFALAGFSLGGIVALEIMRQAPKRVTHLALLSTTPYPMPIESIQPWASLARAAGSDSFASAVTQKMATMFHQERQDDSALLRTLQKMAESIDLSGFQHQLQAQINRPDSRATLTQIASPTLVLVGREDKICPLELHLEMLDLIPNATLVVVKQCGHFSCLEQPKVVTAAMCCWLQAAF